MLAVGACAIVLLFVGFQRTLVRSSEETAPAPAAPPAVDVGAQPTTPMAPPQGQKETASAEPAAAPAPPQISTAAEDTGGNRAADAPAELQKAPSHRQHPAELAVVSTAQTPAPPPQADSGRPDVKEAGGSAHAEKAPAVIVVATPRDVPQSRARQGEQPTTVAPPLSSSAPKKKVIPWP